MSLKTGGTWCSFNNWSHIVNLCIFYCIWHANIMFRCIFVGKIGLKFHINACKYLFSVGSKWSRWGFGVVGSSWFLPWETWRQWTFGGISSLHFDLWKDSPRLVWTVCAALTPAPGQRSRSSRGRSANVQRGSQPKRRVSFDKTLKIIGFKLLQSLNNVSF